MTPQSVTPPENILIVDDTPANLRLLSEMLTEKGYKVRPVLDGRMALSSIEAFLPDLILLDIKMPGMSGFEFCKLLKDNEQTRDIPVIFISAMGETSCKLKAFSTGGADYISKPFQAEEVFARVETHLKLRRTQMALREKEARFRQGRKGMAEGPLIAGMIAHLDTAFGQIIGHIRKAMGDVGDEYSLRPDLRQAAALSHRAQDMIRQTLSLSQCGQPLQESVMPAAVVRNVIKLMRASFSDRIDICENIPDFLPPVLADPARLYQVMISLCTEAVRSMEEEGGVLEIRLSDETVSSQIRKTRPGHYVRLTVKGMRDTRLMSSAVEEMRQALDCKVAVRRDSEGTSALDIFFPASGKREGRSKEIC